MIDFFKAQWLYYTKCSPEFSKETKELYCKNKKLKKEVVSADYWNKYRPLYVNDNDPNIKDKMFINHYRLWCFIGDNMLYGTYFFKANDYKSMYFNYFNINPKPQSLCYLCEFFKSNDSCSSCGRFWKFINKNPWGTAPCTNSFYRFVSFSKDYLTRKQKALICYHIAQLPINEMETMFYKNHLLADLSNDLKLGGIFEYEPTPV